MLIKTFKVAFLIGIFSTAFSCANGVYISMSDHDPFDDEDDVKITEVKEKSQNGKQIKKVIVKEGKTKKEFVEIPDIYEVSCEIPIDEADLQLRSELEERNYKIIKVSYVSRGMKEQGRTDFWEDMRIYMICRLSDGYFVLKHNPWLVGMCPMRIYTYRNEDGKLVIGMFKPSLAQKWMGNPDMKAIEILKTYDKDFKEVLDSICEK